MLTYQDMCLNLKPKQEVYRPPEIEQEYKFIKSKGLTQQQKIEAKSKVHLKYEKYFEDKWGAELHNRDSLLKIYNAIQETKNPETRIKLIHKFCQFRSAIKSFKHRYQALELNWDDFNIEDSQEMEGLNESK